MSSVDGGGMEGRVVSNDDSRDATEDDGNTKASASVPM